MKRHTALHSLSHDHQNALARALRLRRARDADADDRHAEVTSFLEFATTRLEPHFVEEERLLARAAALAPDSVAIAAGGARMAADHDSLRAAFTDLATAGVPTGDDLHALGEQLTAHIRFEERELFEVLQHDVGDRLRELVDA